MHNGLVEIIPAIDIRGGRCVRLEQGDYGRETVFAEDPVSVAVRWQEAGARRLHVVDLDGARDGRPVNTDVVSRILSAVSVPVQVAGGIRDIAAIHRYLVGGADRAVMGTAAVKDETTLLNAVTLFRQRIVVSVDARDGIVRTEGWTQGSDVTALALVRRLSEIGVARIVYTEIGADGMLAGPNFQAIGELLEEVSGLPAPVAVIAAGGISSIEHMRRLAEMGVEGVILGRAIYSGAIDLREAIAALAS
jgi:phosphoribosylformimino-5-aminoimidazole carboxamide ribotide isomerase